MTDRPNHDEPFDFDHCQEVDGGRVWSYQYGEPIKARLLHNEPDPEGEVAVIDCEDEAEPYQYTINVGYLRNLTPPSGGKGERMTLGELVKSCVEGKEDWGRRFEWKGELYRMNWMWGKKGRTPLLVNEKFSQVIPFNPPYFDDSPIQLLPDSTEEKPESKPQPPEPRVKCRNRHPLVGESPYDYVLWMDEETAKVLKALCVSVRPSHPSSYFIHVFTIWKALCDAGLDPLHEGRKAYFTGELHANPLPTQGGE